MPALPEAVTKNVPKVLVEAVVESVDLPALREWLARSDECVRVQFVDPPEGGKDGGRVMAFWTPPGATKKRGEHVICIPTNAGNFITSPATRKRAVDAAIRHETWHARLTDRRTYAIAEVLDEYRIPAQLMNLFEDARIEDYARWSEGEDFGYFTGPSPMYDPKTIGSLTDPAALFQLLSLCEGNTRTMSVVASKWWGAAQVFYRGRRVDVVQFVSAIVRRAQFAHTTLHLIPLIIEFLEAFPDLMMNEDERDERQKARAAGIPMPDPEGDAIASQAPLRPAMDAMGIPVPGREMAGTDQRVEGGGSGDEGEESDADGDGDEDAEENGYGYGGLWDPNKGQKERDRASLRAVRELLQSFRKGPTTEESKVDAGLRPFLCDYPPDLTNAPLIAERLRRMVGQTDASRVRTATHGTRLHLPKVMLGENDGFRFNVTRKGRRKVCCVMDMSGSMNHAFSSNGGAFIEALMMLQRQGVMDAVVWLSGGGRRYRLPYGTTAEVITQLGATHGCETIMATLDAARDDVMSADTVIVYTDGALTDGDIDTAKWRARGVDLIGVMALPDEHLHRRDDGQISQRALEAHFRPDADTRAREDHNAKSFRTQMERHFHKVIVSPDGVQLAVAIGQYVLTKT